MAQDFCKILGAGQQKALIVGAGATGTELARRLAEGWDITLLGLKLDYPRETLGDSAYNVRLMQGDGTSRLALKDAGVVTADVVVVACAPDEVSLEVCKVLNRDFSVPRVVVLLRRSESMPDAVTEGVEYVHEFGAIAGTLASRISSGTNLAANVGMGDGEILETQILANSSIIGKQLSQLSPSRWLVAAVYRDSKLIIPHGDTTLEEGDRVLLVGDPRILPCIARYLKTGHSEFPLHYGTGIGVALTAATLPALDEVLYLLKSTQAERIELMTPEGGTGQATQAEQFVTERGFPVSVEQMPNLSTPMFAKAIPHKDWGVLVLPPQPMNWKERIGLRRSDLVRRLDDATMPVLIPRGTHPYKEIMYALIRPEADIQGATLAIDASRMLGARLTIAAAFSPDFVSGPGMRSMTEDAIEQVSELASTYGVRPEILKLEGNPVRSLLVASKDFNLVVVGHKKGARTSLINPGVEHNLVHRCQRSVMVLPT